MFVQNDPRLNESTFNVNGEEHESKGTNNVISMIHDYLENCENKKGAKHLIVITDNCSGENKRVKQGYHKLISRLFLEVGHTHFEPETALGLFRHLEAKSGPQNIHA